PGVNILSLYLVEEKVRKTTGVNPLMHDMCVDSCVAFTGPFAGYEQCPECNQPRYSGPPARPGAPRKPRKQFMTLPLGTQLQGMWGSPAEARNMSYAARRVEEVKAFRRQNPGNPGSWTDLIDGDDFLAAVKRKHVNPATDPILILSLDGAQLYRNKTSECWIFIWIILNREPALRYKKQYIMPGGFIPGPKKPKNIDSFLFPSLHHLAALQKEGLKVWNALDGRV
ncbi:hypothetical protein SISSUDRAFT_994105, partial [Sistotremastrum suecicum HHB10207 ss-3]